MANTGSSGIIEYNEQWIADSVAGGAAAGAGSAADGIAWLGSSDAGNTPFARAVAAGRGIHLAGALDATDDDMLALASDTLLFAGQEGYAMLEVLFQVSSIADLAINIGLNDEVLEATSNTLPVELATTVWTTSASTFLGLVYDVDATNDDVHCMWVDDDNDSAEALANLRMQGIAPVASKWCMARVEMQDRGSGNGVRGTFTFSCDGKTATKEFNTTVDRDCPLSAFIGFENRAATVHNVYIKYIKIAQSISD